MTSLMVVSIYSTDLSVITVTIDGSTCDVQSVTDTSIVCVTNSHEGAIETQVSVEIGTDGIAYQVHVERFIYVYMTCLTM